MDMFRRVSDGLLSGRPFVFTLFTTACKLVLVLSQPRNAPGYLGCYKDCDSLFCGRALRIGPEDSDDQSVEWCFKYCLDTLTSSYKYAGLEYAYECFCGSNENYGRHGERSDSECQDRCTGNSNQFCGDSDRISIYKISQGVCTNNIGPPTNGDHEITNPRSLSYNLDNFKFFGTRVDFSCDTGYTLHGASSIECIATDYNNVTWSDSVPTCEVPGYLGCFRDNVTRALSVGPVKELTKQSVEWCFRNCSEPTEYKYAGLEFGQDCFCGNNEVYDKHDKKPESDCQDRCTGNSDQVCGDLWHLSVYRISDGVCSNEIGPPTNGDHEITNPRSLSYNLDNFKFFGTRVHFSCDPGYTLHGASSIECIETGYNNVTWSDSVPTCEVPTTSDLTTLSTYTTPNSTTSQPLTGYTSDVGESQTRTTQRTSTEILPPTWESTRAPDHGTNNPIAGKLGTGEVAGIAVGALVALTVLIVALAFLWRKRIRKPKEQKEPDIALDTVGAHYVNHTFANPILDTSGTAQSQGDRDNAPPVYSQVVKKRPADEGATLTVPPQNDKDGDSGWVDNEVYGCESFPIEIEARNKDRDGQPNDQPPITMEGKPGWVENIIYE